MNFLYFILFSIFATLSLAQSVQIGAPARGATYRPGHRITVEVDRPDSLEGSDEVAVVIALFPCESATSCPGPENELGDILYNGPYNPQFHNVPGLPPKPPHQNFTVTVPDTFPSGSAQLGVVHLCLTGAAPYAYLQQIYEVITIS